MDRPSRIPSTNSIPDEAAMETVMPIEKSANEGIQMITEEERDKALELSIRESTLRAKCGYFAMYAGLSASPYYGLLLSKKLFSPMAVGVISAFMPLSNLVFLPPLSYVADRYHCALGIMACAAASSAVLLLLVTLASSHDVITMAMIGHFIFRVPLGPFMDQRAMSILPPDRKLQWGPMRSYGAYGWAIGALALSAFVGWWGWWTCAVLFILGVGIVGMYTFLTIIPHDTPHHATMNYVEVLKYVAAHRRLVTFLSAQCFMGMGYSLINTYLFMFLDTIGAPPILLGISVIMTVVVEIPLFQCSKYIHENATDRQLLFISMCVWSIRVMGYSFLWNPWLVLFLEPLHGFTFGLMWLSGMHFVRKAFPRSLSHSSVGFLSATTFGVGPLAGNLIGGTLYQHLEGRWMFRVMSLVMLVVGAVFMIVDRHLERQGYKEEAAEEEIIVESAATTEEVVVEEMEKQ